MLKIRRVEKELEYNFVKSKNNNSLIAGLSPRASVDTARRSRPLQIWPYFIVCVQVWVPTRGKYFLSFSFRGRRVTSFLFFVARTRMTGTSKRSRLLGPKNEQSKMYFEFGDVRSKTPWLSTKLPSPSRPPYRKCPLKGAVGVRRKKSARLESAPMRRKPHRRIPFN